MSKELEEILDNLPHSIRYSGEIEPLKEYAKEQAERVQELEDKLARIRFVNNDYDKQNKRYREALEEIASEDEWETVDEARGMARKALEDGE